MGREGKATWSNDRAIFNFYHAWLRCDVRPLAHLSYVAIFDIAVWPCLISCFKHHLTTIWGGGVG